LALFKSAAVISGLTLVSRISGLARDTLIARTFGASPITDAFWVAFRIPNLLRRLFAEGAFSQAFVPILGAARQQHGDEGIRPLLDRVALLLTAVLALLVVVGIAAAPWVVTVIASGMRDRGGEAFAAAVSMTRFMFPYILFMSLAAFATGVLNTWRRFAIPAFTPVLLNLCMIASCLWISPRLGLPIFGLAIGVMIGGVLQLAVQWAELAHIGLAPRLLKTRLKEAWNDPTVRRIIRQMGPATLGVSVAQVSLLINTNIATWLKPGSVTWLSFADRLMEFPTAILGVALGTVLLPSLSAAHARKDYDTYSHLIDAGLRLTLLLGLPAVLGMALLSDGLVATLFNYGAFHASDVQQTRLAVIAYSVGLIGLLSVKILAPGFYARQDIRTPVKIAVAVLVLTQVFNLIFVPLYAHAGLALSIGLGACVNSATLLVVLRRRGAYRPEPGWGRFMLRILPALAGMAALLGYADSRLDWIALQAHAGQRVLWLAAVMAASAAVYFAMLFAAGFRPADFGRPGSGR
jgi:putative peptidoglycan lipid II flippase